MASKEKSKPLVKKALILLNVFLTLLCFYSSYSLYRTLSYQNIATRSPLEYSFMDLKRPKIEPRFGPALDLFPKGGENIAKPSAGPSGSKAPHLSAGLNELSAGDEIIRVVGIFIGKSGSYAAISISKREKGSAGYAQLKKVTVGDPVKDYVVQSITPGYIKLRSGSLKEVILGIFKNSH